MKGNKEGLVKGRPHALSLNLLSFFEKTGAVKSLEELRKERTSGESDKGGRG